MASKLDVWIVNYRLKYLTITFRKDGSERLGLVHHMTHGTLEKVMLDDTLDSAKHAQLPLVIGVTSFLGQPDIQLPPRKRKRPVITFHRSPPTA